MNRKMIITSCVVGLVLRSLISHGQSSLSISVPVIYSKVTVKNNWSPPTAVHRIDQFNGIATGSGINLNYSFRPAFIFKNRYKHFAINVGVGYYSQLFNITRPFDYNSFIYIIYYTNYYVYRCLNLSIGLTYESQIGKNYFLNSTLTYYRLNSFRQDYTPTYSSPNRGFDGFTQINYNNIYLGDILNLTIGINRKLGERFSLCLNMMIPLYTRWRNDKIFGDDPSTFTCPSYSLGGSISVAYRFVEEK